MSRISAIKQSSEQMPVCRQWGACATLTQLPHEGLSLSRAHI